MNNEEAIKYLEDADVTVYQEHKTPTAEALEMGIKALKKVSYLKKYERPCNACIFSNGVTEYDNGCTQWKCVFDE